MLEYLPKQFSSLLGLIQNLSKDKRELKDNALKSVSHALNETYLYYNSLSKGKDRDQDLENLLSNYWAAAAIPLRHIDENLAMTCEFKAEYWVNPNNWEQEQIIEHGIALERLKTEYRNMLAPKFKMSGRKKRIEPKFT